MNESMNELLLILKSIKNATLICKISFLILYAILSHPPGQVACIIVAFGMNRNVKQH